MMRSQEKIFRNAYDESKATPTTHASNKTFQVAFDDRRHRRYRKAARPSSCSCTVGATFPVGSGFSSKLSEVAFHMLFTGIGRSVMLRKPSFVARQRVERSGIYRVVHQPAHVRAHEITVVEGERFPACREKVCHPRFVLVREAPIVQSSSVLKADRSP
jgi:hypothetical protein